MARRNFATVDALLILACVAIFVGGALAQTDVLATFAPPSHGSSVGDRS